MSESLIVLFDFKDPYSYLSLEPTCALVAELGADCRWQPFLGSTLRAPVPPVAGDPRGSWHRWHRARYYQRDLCRYAEARGLPARHFADGDLYRQSSAEVAAMGLNWLVAGATGTPVARVATKQQEGYLNKTFRGYWDGDLDLDSVEQIVSLLESCGGAREGFAEYCEITGRDDLAAMRSSLIERGAFTAPAFLIGGEVYVGRQHLPMVRQRLSGGRSATLI